MHKIKKETSLLALIFLCAFALRLVNLGNVLDSKGLVLFDPDAACHLSLIKKTLDNYPSVPSYDTGLNHPDGLKVPWPPLLTFTAATFALPGKIIAGNKGADFMLALFSPLLTSLALIPLYLLLKRFRSPLTTWSALVFYSIITPTLTVGMAGYLDHEAALIPLSLLVGLGFIKIMEGGRFWLLAISTAGMTLTWSGCVIYLVPLGVVSIILHFSGQGQGKPPRAGQAMFIAALIYLAGLALWGPPGWHKPSFVFPSLLQAQELLYFSLFLMSLRGKGSSLKEAVIGALAGFMLLIIVPATLSELYQGLKYFGGDSSATFVMEKRPLLGYASLPLKVEVISLFKNSGLLLVIAPFALIIKIRKERTPLNWLALCSVLIFGLYAFRQVRYLPMLKPWLAIAGGLFIDAAGSRHSGWKKAASGLALSALVLSPSADIIFNLNKVGSPSMTTLAVHAARWLNSYDGERGGVMVNSYFGYIFYYYSGLPVVTDGYLEPGPGEGLLDTAQFYVAANEDGARKILMKRSVRYVVVVPPQLELDKDAAVLGLPPGWLFNYQPNPNGLAFIEPLEPYYDTMASRLYYNRRGPYGKGAPKGFKLIYPPEGVNMLQKDQIIPFMIYEFKP